MIILCSPPPTPKPHHDDGGKQRKRKGGRGMVRQKESKRKAVCNPLTISTKENRKRKVSYDTPIADLLQRKSSPFTTS